MHIKWHLRAGMLLGVCRYVTLTVALCISAAAQLATAVTLQSSLASPTLGRSVKFTATASPSSATGTVTFLDGANILGVEPLTNGQAILTTSLLAAGAHSIAAFYGGDKSDAASVSAPLRMIVRSLPGFGFQPLQSPGGTEFTNSIAVADFNNDGIPDLALTDTEIAPLIGVQYGDLKVLLGNGDGTFRLAWTDNIFFGPAIVVAADFNSDGITDLATFGGVYLGNGDGTFQNIIRYSSFGNTGSAYPPTSLAAGDFNGDGRVDLAWSAGIDGLQGGVVAILAGNGDGTFQAPVYTTVANPQTLAVGDFNGDGRADLAIANGVNNGVTILLGKGDCTFQKPAQYSMTASARMLVVADFDGDGRDDLAVGGNVIGTQSGFMSMFLSNPDGTLQNIQNWALPGYLSGLAAGDFNGDGRIDVAAEYGPITNLTARDVYLMSGNGDGTLQNPVLGANGAFFSQLAAADFNNDGRTDLAAVYLVENTGEGIEAMLGKPAPLGPSAVSSVLNAANFQPGIEAGSWVTIQGTNLANDARVWQAFDFPGIGLPTLVDGVSVEIDGNPAFVEFISPTQINVQAPSDSATGAVNVVVTNHGLASPPATAELQTFAPAFFLSGANSVSASLLPNYTPVTAAAPAHPGDTVVLWGTGFGPTTPSAPAGVEVSGAPMTSTLPLVTVGTVQVQVVSSVLTTGTVGLYQITIQLPANAPTGTPAVQASIGGVSTQPGVTLFIGAP